MVVCIVEFAAPSAVCMRVDMTVTRAVVIASVAACAVAAAAVSIFTDRHTLILALPLLITALPFNFFALCFLLFLLLLSPFPLFSLSPRLCVLLDALQLVLLAYS